MVSRIVFDSKVYIGPSITVLFEGRGSPKQSVRTEVDYTSLVEPTLQDVVGAAWQQRFGISIDASLHRGPKYFSVVAVDSLERHELNDLACALTPEEDELVEAAHPLILVYEIPNQTLANARAHVCSLRVKALQKAAATLVPPVKVSDTILAKIMINKLCSPFSKALGRATEATFADGMLVGKIEAKLAIYEGPGGQEALVAEVEACGADKVCLAIALPYFPLLLF